MKLTESQLRTAIREELINYLNEDKEVLEEGKLTNIFASIFAALAIGGMAGASINQTPTSNDVIKMSDRAQQPANEAATIVKNKNIELGKDGSFSIGGKRIGKFSPETVEAIKELNEIGDVAHTGANTNKLNHVRKLYNKIESDSSYPTIKASIQNLEGVRTHTQDQKVFIFGIIVAAGMVGLTLTAFANPIKRLVQK